MRSPFRPAATVMHRRTFLLQLKGMLAGAAAADQTSPRPMRAAAGRKKRILIIGAGFSGLAAARQLHGLGHEVQVLEGRQRSGGRIHTSREWADLPLDHGATWIHGVRGNPIMREAAALKARLLETRYEDYVAYQTSGRRFTLAEEQARESLGDQIAKKIRKEQSAGRDVALRDAVEEWIGPGAPADTAGLARFILSSDYEQEYAGSINDLSTYWFDSDKSFGGGDKLFAEGYQVVIDYLAQGLDLKTGHTVRAIDWSGPVVRVTTDAAEFTADRVLVTLPLGVLKAGDVAFHPALPDGKKQAIERLGMGVLNKCYLRFPRAFWPEDVDWIEFVPEVHGKWSQWVSFMKAARQPVLLGFYAADEGRAMELLTDGQIVASAMETLRTIYGSKIPEPTGHQITRWANDPFARGSYSFNALGSTPAMRKVLAKPLQNRLFFAGEATSTAYFGTTHGAYLSGIRAAREMASARSTG